VSRSVRLPGYPVLQLDKLEELGDEPVHLWASARVGLARASGSVWTIRAFGRLAPSLKRAFAPARRVRRGDRLFSRGWESRNAAEGSISAAFLALRQLS
jgi:hypothetical protein